MPDEENNNNGEDRPKSSEEMLRDFRSSVDDATEDLRVGEDDRDEITDRDDRMSATEIAEALYPAPSVDPPRAPSPPAPPSGSFPPPPGDVFARPGDDPGTRETRPATGDDRVARHGTITTPPVRPKTFMQKYGRIAVGLGIAGVVGFSLFSNGTTNVGDLAVGDCLQSPEGPIVEVVDEVACAETHDYEVFALADLPIYPTEDRLFEAAFEQCVPHFEGYVGVAFEESEVWVEAFPPTRQSWDSGERGVTCLLYVTDAAFNLQASEGSLRDSNR